MSGNEQTGSDRGAMYAVVVREAGTADLVRRSGDILHARVVPQVQQAPGVVTALWMTDERGQTLNVIVFDGEEAARAALGRVRNAPRPDFLRLEDASVYEVLARF